MKKREGMEELKPSIPSRFFVKEKCIFSIRRVAPLAGAWIEIKIKVEF